MINKDILSQITQQLSSSIRSALEQLSSLGATITDAWNDLANDLSPLLDLLCYLESPEISIAIDGEVVDFFVEMANDAQALFCSTNLGSILAVDSTFVDENTLAISINNTQVCSLSVPTKEFIERLSADVIGQITYQLEDAVTGLTNKGAMYHALADICSTASSGDWTQLTGKTEIITTLVSHYSAQLGEYKDDLIRSLAHGPQGLVSCVSQLFSQVNTIYENGDLSSLLNSTDVTLNNFAFGIVMDSVSAIFTTAGLLLASFSRIIGGIALAVGAVVSFIGRVVTSLTTSYDDTQYEISSGSDVLHAFSFVIDQNSSSNMSLAKYMREHGWPTMTVHVPSIGLVYLIFLNNFTDASDYSYTYEVHLSADVDLTEALSTVQFGTGSYPMINFPLFDAGSRRDADIVYVPKYNVPADGDTQLSIALRSYGSNVDVPNFTTFKLNNAKFVKPINFDMWDSVEQWYKSSFTDVLDIRLCSALIAYSAYQLCSLYRAKYSHIAGHGTESLRVIRCKSADFINSDSALYRLFSIWDAAWAAFVDETAFDGLNPVKTELGLSNEQRDTLLNAVVAYFDGLWYTQHLAISANFRCLDGWVENGEMVLHTILYNDYYTISAEDMSRYLRVSFQPYWVGSGISVFNADAISGSWSNNFMCKLPTLTWNGFILGLIVDGLVVVAVAATAVVAFNTYRKFVQYRTRQLAMAQSAWRNYADSGYTKEALATYKRQTRKYNTLAFITGGPTISYGYISPSAPVSFSNAEESNSNLTVLSDQITSLEHIIKG